MSLAWRKSPPAQRLARSVLHRFHSHDVRMYLFNDTIHRVESAIARAGGEQIGGQTGLKPHIKRWTLLRSPHVNKTSREKFWMVTNRRIVRWQAGPGVSVDAASQIVSRLPASVAVRTVEQVPGLWALRAVFDVISAGREGRVMNAATSPSSTDDVDNTGETESEEGYEELQQADAFSEPQDEISDDQPEGK